MAAFRDSSVPSTAFEAVTANSTILLSTAGNDSPSFDCMAISSVVAALTAFKAAVLSVALFFES